VKLAVDFSGARPDPGELARLNLDALGYVGSSRPDQTYLDALTSAGVRFTFIFETDPNRSQQGYQAGRLDAQFFEQRVKERGYPPTMPAMVVVSDGTATSPSSGGNAIADYGRGWADTTTRPLCAYGNRYAVDAFNRGVPASRLLARGGGWLPIPWGGNAAQDVMGQDANTPSPIPGTDLDRVWVDYFAPSPAPPVPPPAQIALEDDMELVVGTLMGQIGNVALLMAGAKCVAEFAGPTVDVFGMSIPTAMIRWRDSHPSRAAIKLVYLGTDAFAGAIMANLRWPTWQTGAGLT
jgi:hypothetical protein